MPVCPAGHQMRINAQFKLDHEPTDDPGVTLQLVETLRGLEAAGVAARGADVTLWYCEICDLAEAEFIYPDDDPLPDAVA
jgi:hypothetical protein